MDYEEVKERVRLSNRLTECILELVIEHAPDIIFRAVEKVLEEEKKGDRKRCLSTRQ